MKLDAPAMAGASVRSLTLRPRFPIELEEEDRVSHDDVLFGYRLRLFTLAEEIGVRPACRAMGVHHSTYYRWKANVDRWGLESLRVRELADRAMRQIVQRRGLARFMKLTETHGVYAAHPLGGCRMAESKDLGVVDHRCEAFDNEGLFCIDSSAIPTSLGVNPSLTISAVSERAVASLVHRGHDYGLPRLPAGFKPHRPHVHVGERVVPRRR